MTRIVFMGTPEFAVPSLDLLVESGYRPVAVVTSPDRKKGRGRKVQTSAVKDAAIRHGIQTILQPERVKDDSFAAEIRKLDADILVVVAFRILPPAVFSASRLGAFNLHGSLLPAYRGAAPIHRAVMAGEKRTGVTTFFLQEKVDTGNVIYQESMEIGPDETTGDVHDRMMHLGAGAVLTTVKWIEAGEARAMQQDDALATSAPKVYPTEARIPWEKESHEVHNHIRGLSPVPGAYTMHGENRLKVYRSRIATHPEVASADAVPGCVSGLPDRLVVACGTGAVELLEIQAPGRRRMDARSFLAGYPMEQGGTLG